MAHSINRLQLQDARGALRSPLTVAVISDLHNGPFDDVLDAIGEADAVLVPGDLLDRHHPGTVQVEAFLAQVPALKPTLVSLGNHDLISKEAPQLRQMLQRSAAVLLDDSVTLLRPDVAVGGLSSQLEPVSTTVLNRLERVRAFRLLLSHHPEYYPRYVRGRSIDLTISGHAHGGQVRIGRQGLYAPGQGLLPRYTSGWYDDSRLLVSRGMTNSASAPRVNNPCELLLLTLLPAS